MYNDLPVVQRRIMQFIAKEVEGGEAEEGVNVGAISRNAGSGVSLDKIKQELENLISDGHLYQTIDDDQYVSDLGVDVRRSLTCLRPTASYRRISSAFLQPPCTCFTSRIAVWRMTETEGEARRLTSLRIVEAHYTGIQVCTVCEGPLGVYRLHVVRATP